MIFAAAMEGVPAAYDELSTGSGLGATVFAGSAFFASTGAATTAGETVESAVVDSNPAGFSAEVSIKHTTAPTATASPSSALRVIVPLSSAGSSSVALSESISAIA
jgi:hypothetical protein